VVRHTENDFHMAACFDPGDGGCMYSAACALKSALGRATAAFMAELDAVTLADMVAREVPKKGRNGVVPGELKTVVLHRKKPAGVRK
jgi:Rrf2 family nitric oxide-sensitive transcriptional repressor